MNLPSTKKEAEAMGAKFYDTGKPCKHGHYTNRRTTTAICEDCNRKQAKEYYRRASAKLQGSANIVKLTARY